MLYIKTHGPAFNFVPVGCGEVPKLILGGNNNFQGTFLPTLFLGQKHPRLIYPRYSTITGFDPKTGCVKRIMRGRAAGCGVVQHANEARCNAGTAQVQALYRCRHCRAQITQAQRRCPYRCCAVQRGKICE
jgi:hypothetical protein